MKIIWHTEDDALSLAESLASEIANQLNQSLADRGSAVLALSGGSTPKPMFAALATQKVDWSKVVVTLVDERWVDESHALSNAAFLRKYFLDALASQATFLPLYKSADGVEDSFKHVLDAYCQITNSSPDQPRPFDVVILGMGDDGHTASFFPDASNIDALVDSSTENLLASCYSKSSQVQRITWTLKMLLQPSYLALHFTGSIKKQVFEKAQVAGELSELPIRSAIFQDQRPLHVYYAD